MPRLHSPFPPQCHPDLALAAESNLAWARVSGLLTSPAAVSRFTALQPALLAAGAYVAVDRDALMLAADWCSWLLLFDDQGDESPCGRDHHLWRTLVHPLDPVVRGEVRAPNDLQPLACALHNLLSRTTPGMSDAWTARFRRHLAAHLASYADEARHRAHLLKPQTAAYITHRRNSGATRVVFDLLEPAHGVEIPEDWFHSREHQDVHPAAADIVCWENDIVSMRKELAGGSAGERRRVAVTLGTVLTDLDGVRSIARLIEHAAAVDAEFLLAIGDADLAPLGTLPPNVRPLPWVPLAQLLDGSDAIVHHGGAGTMMTAAAVGTPQLILPQGADHFDNAAAAEASGFALRATADAVDSHLLDALLNDDGLRKAATAMRAEIAALPSPAALVPAFEDLAATR
ncbi:nucleotide disphospho-sugar-binding domain-containing protein [Streptomyces sp. NPDC088400]|uniref:terpene synthase family protein n=1 Tax=Streptomyces sp. NPDC088400 TaxID=3365861 RepID=UPI0038001331